MAEKKRRKKSGGAPAKEAAPAPPLDQMRTGMPALDSIVEITQLKHGKKTYRLLVTNEVDEYEPKPRKKR